MSKGAKGKRKKKADAEAAEAEAAAAEIGLTKEDMYSKQWTKYSKGIIKIEKYPVAFEGYIGVNVPNERPLSLFRHQRE